ncbi:hypothetical protein CW751_00065 [Brumimicrobium salinarum]|uniref:Uncharacterized protein n=1 Tax=Brumimicrobium salinarum TaxID=2058658 RepID=A0A2I0R5A8_9FLAO|nr:hypothetical protein [Brumimicrobium salinarum]PKR81771.1 hypothetical protein CW751_00065 [Brumimicrobium salinarum]
MYKAKNKKTNEVIEADELKVINNVSSIDFVCVDDKCAIPLIACSFQETNKKRPYFKKHSNQEHTDSCSYSEYLKLLEVGKTRRLTDLEFEKLDYPSKLVFSLPKVKDTLTLTSELLPDSNSTAKKTISNGEFAEVANANRRVTSISQIVDFYLSCPFNRDVELDLLGVKMSYKFHFKRIYGENTGAYIDNKIFYGRVSLNSIDSEVSDENYLYLKLFECEDWERNNSLTSNNKQINPYFLKINKEEISKYKINRILKEKETVSNLSKNDYRINKKHGREAWVFFIGRKPSLKNLYEFEVVNGFITFRYTIVQPIKAD